MAATQRRGLLPQERDDDFMRLKDAHVVAAKTLLEVWENIRVAVEAKAMICIYGATGHGESLAVNCLAARAGSGTDAPYPVPGQAHHPGPAVRALSRSGTAGPPAGPADRVRPGAARCDGARWPSRHWCGAWFRCLWVEPSTRLAVIFVGGEGCHTVLRREAMFSSSRVFVWQYFTRLTPAEVLEAVPLSHPVWPTLTATTSPSPAATPHTAMSTPGPG
ncbi:ATP-binding protein [Streptomyces sp. NPDC001709]